MKLIATKLKTLAQELDTTVIMLAQLNDDGKLEGSKGMKNECDLSMQLHQMSEEEIRENGNWLIIIWVSTKIETAKLFMILEKCHNIPIKIKKANTQYLNYKSILEILGRMIKEDELALFLRRLERTDNILYDLEKLEGLEIDDKLINKKPDTKDIYSILMELVLRSLRLNLLTFDEGLDLF